ncbi:MAG: adenylate/guanylate cyclase domain-containing protein [Deltaproteobacteria bacterium]|nr:adenylate/guanylate cyclase domain-containing protein [Deltaproteobacteria bacterium]
MKVSTQDDVFSQALGRATLEAERLRHTLLAGLTGVASVVAFVLINASPEYIARVTGDGLFGSSITRIPSILLLTVCGYEVLMRYLAGKALAERRQPSTWARYGNALAESAIPTVGVLLEASFSSLFIAILSPPVFLYFVFIALSGLRLDFRLSLFTAACAATQYWVLAAYAISHVDDGAFHPLLTTVPSHIGKGLFLLLTGLVTGVVGMQVKAAMTSSIKHLAEKERVVDLFGQQVSSAVVTKLLSQTDTLSEARHVCVMFLDIRDFTTFSEKRRPQEVVDYLNTLWSFTVDIVNAHDGIINKFLGDGFMATFGAPVSSGDDCKNAVLAARAILARTALEQANGTLPPTRVGIGLHAGEAVTGNIGGKQRKEYSVIGDVVNLASRIESLNKAHGAQLLISEDVRKGAEAETKDAVSLGPISVKGRQQPVEVFKLA